VLVVDGGTALTYTAVVGREVVGGAIAPGIRLQLQALHQGTAALPDLTSAAIHSGVLYSVLASIHDFLAAWRRDYPHSKVVLTGGDSTFIYQHLKPFAQPVILDPQVIFKGMAACRQAGWGNGRVRK
jgi:type III pantothenate kinase